jgi:hypothetical protein
MRNASGGDDTGSEVEVDVTRGVGLTGIELGVSVTVSVETGTVVSGTLPACFPQETSRTRMTIQKCHTNFEAMASLLFVIH